MANTLLQQLPVLSQKVYKEWFADTKLVKSCSTEFEGEFDTDKLEIDIPVFGHLPFLHQTIAFLRFALFLKCILTDNKSLLGHHGFRSYNNA